MLKEFAWKAFENTGNVDVYMFYREVDERGKALAEKKVAVDEVATSNSIHNIFPI